MSIKPKFNKFKVGDIAWVLPMMPVAGAKRVKIIHCSSSQDDYQGEYESYVYIAIDPNDEDYILGHGIELYHTREEGSEALEKLHNS